MERIIGVLKQKYTILQNILPISLITDNKDNNMSTIDKIVKVCCACVNLCPSVVPQDNHFFLFPQNFDNFLHEGQYHLPFGGHLIRRQSK